MGGHSGKHTAAGYKESKNAQSNIRQKAWKGRLGQLRRLLFLYIAGSRPLPGHLVSAPLKPFKAERVGHFAVWNVHVAWGKSTDMVSEFSYKPRFCTSWSCGKAKNFGTSALRNIKYVSQLLNYFLTAPKPPFCTLLCDAGDGTLQSTFLLCPRLPARFCQKWG